MKRILILVLGILLLSACGAPTTTPQVTEEQVTEEAAPEAEAPPTPTTHTLSVSVSPSRAGSVSPPGGEYEPGLQVTLTATPASRYTFDYWDGAASGSSHTTTITMDSNKSITAHFKEKEVATYSLSVSVQPSGSGSVTPSSGDYLAGTGATLVATAAPGYEFDQWSGDASGSSPTITVTMDSNKSVTAHFKAQYTLSTSVSPSGSGTVSPASGTYDAGTEVTLSATPAKGYVFDHWGGDATGTLSSVSITMSSEKSVTAYFETMFVSSDGQIGIILDRIERAGVMPAEFKGGPPAEGYDYVCVYLVFAHVGKAYLDPFEQEEQEITLQDVEHREYKVKDMVWEGVKFWNPLNLAGSAYVSEGTKAILVFELPKHQKPVKLTFVYFFKESREEKTVKRGQMEITF